MQENATASNYIADIIRMYKSTTNTFLALLGVKTDEAAHIRKIVALDIRFLHGSALP
jgi:hypothetical protein